MFRTSIMFVMILFLMTGCTITKTTSDLSGGKIKETKKEKLGLFGWKEVPIEK